MYKNYVEMPDFITEGIKDKVKDAVNNYIKYPQFTNKMSKRSMKKAFSMENESAQDAAGEIYEKYIYGYNGIGRLADRLGYTLTLRSNGYGFMINASNWNVTVRPEALVEVIPLYDITGDYRNVKSNIDANNSEDIQVMRELMKLEKLYKRYNDPNTASKSHENMISLISNSGLFKFTTNMGYDKFTENYTDPKQCAGVVLLIKTIMEFIIAKDNNILSLDKIRTFFEDSESDESASMEIKSISGNVASQIDFSNLNLNGAANFLNDVKKILLDIDHDTLPSVINKREEKYNEFNDVNDIRQRGYFHRSFEGKRDRVPSIYQYIKENYK